MAWGRYDDQADDDPRFWELPLAAIGLYWAALARTLRRDENVIPSSQLDKLTARTKEYADPHPLVEAGLWVEIGPNTWAYDAEDWDRIRMPEAKRRELAEKRAEAGRMGGTASGKSRQGLPNEPTHEANRSKADGSLKQNGSKRKQTNPVPDPYPTRPDPSRTRPVPDPESVPVSVTQSEEGDSVESSAQFSQTARDGPPVIAEIVTRQNYGAVYAEAAKAAGYTPNPGYVKRVGAEAKAAARAGMADGLIAGTCRRLAQRNLGPSLFGVAMADEERGTVGSGAWRQPPDDETWRREIAAKWGMPQ